MVDKAFYDTHSKRTNEWYTPLEVYKRLDREFHFQTDPAAEESNRLGCRIYLTEKENGLDSSKWRGSCFINPPYSHPKYPVYQWVKTASEYNRRTGNVVVMLLRATPETEWFQDFVWDERVHDWRPGVRVRFPRGRLKFVTAAEGNNDNNNNNNNTPTFASVIVIFNHHHEHYQQLPPLPQSQEKQLPPQLEQQLQLSEFFR